MSETRDHHYQDESGLFISPKGEDFGLGITRTGDGIHVGLADEEGDGGATVLTVEQAAIAGRELLRLSVGPVYESPEELAAEIARLRTDNASLTAARDRARRDRDDWHEAYNTLCSDLAYEMGMENPSIAGDRGVKARVAELVRDVKVLTADRDKALEAYDALQAKTNRDASISGFKSAMADEQRMEESARVGRCGAESRRLYPDGRAEPTFCALPAGHAGWHRGDSGATEWNDPAPSPRDTDLIQQVRALVKRYGAPVIAAEAARQAKHH